MARPTAGGTAPFAPQMISRKRMNRGSRGHRNAFAALKSLSKNLPAPPATYDTTKQYRVQLSKAVQTPNGRWLRPTQDVVLSGAFAQTIAASIVGAQALSSAFAFPRCIKSTPAMIWVRRRCSMEHQVPGHRRTLMLWKRSLTKSTTLPTRSSMPASTG